MAAGFCWCAGGLRVCVDRSRRCARACSVSLCCGWAAVGAFPVANPADVMVDGDGCSSAVSRRRPCAAVAMPLCACHCAERVPQIRAGVVALPLYAPARRSRRARRRQPSPPPPQQTPLARAACGRRRVDLWTCALGGSWCAAMFAHNIRRRATSPPPAAPAMDADRPAAAALADPQNARRALPAAPDTLAIRSLVFTAGVGVRRRLVGMARGYLRWFRRCQVAGGRRRGHPGFALHDDDVVDHFLTARPLGCFAARGL